MNWKKRVISSILVVVILMCSYLTVHAEEVIPIVTLSDNTINQGSNGNLDLTLSNSVDYSVLEINIYYDETLFTVNGVSYGSIFQNMPDHQKSFNIDEPGVISLAVATTEDTIATGSLLNISITPKSTTPTGVYTFTTAVLSSYDALQNPININTADGKITVTEAPVYQNTIYFYDHLSQTSVEQHDTVTYKISSSNLYDLATTNFEIYYDSEKLSVTNIQLGPTLTQNNMYSEINSNTEGFVNIAFASVSGISSASPVLEITFNVLVDEDVFTDILFFAKNTYEESLEPIASNKVTTTVNIDKKPIVVDNPDLTLTSYSGSSTEVFNILVELDKNSALAAGDFTISYDTSAINVESIEKIYTSSYLLFNHKPEIGEITFSIIESEGIINAISLLKINATSIDQSTDLQTSMSISGSNIVDKELNNITLDFVDASISLVYPWIYGDVDLTQTVSVADVATIQLYLAGYITLSDVQLKCADVNLDDTVSIEDVAIIQLQLAELYSSWPTRTDVSASVGNLNLYSHHFNKLLSFQNLFIKNNTTDINTTDLGFDFSDQSFVYDKTTHQLTIQGKLPDWITGIQYAGHQRTDVGSQYAIVSFDVEEGHDPIPNMIAKLTITPAEMTDISLEDKSIIYDGEAHKLTLSDNETQFGDTFLIKNPLQNFILPGTYEQTITLSHPNYFDLTLEGVLNVLKRPSKITQDDVTFNFYSNSLIIESNYHNRLQVSLDGLSYSNTLEYVDLESNQEYEVSVYLEETELDEMSNFLLFSFKTYENAEGIRDNINSLAVNQNNAFNLLHEYKSKIDSIHPNKIDNILTVLEQKIDAYNQFVTQINDEFNQIYPKDKELHFQPRINDSSLAILPTRRKIHESG